MSSEYYTFLGISQTATETEIKKAYYKKALELHPDKNKSPTAKEEFHKLQKIYSVLSVPSRRADYDKYGEDEDENYDQEGSDVEETTEAWKMYSVEELESLLAALEKDGSDLNPMKLINDLNFTDKLQKYGGSDFLVEIFKDAKKQNVSYLDLSRRAIENIPSDIGKITSLESLIMRNNKIVDLPPNFSGLINLKVLDLGVNSLTSIPPIIYTLSSLTELNLEHNKITQIDPEISQLINLEILNLFANQLTIIPQEICELANIRKLDFGVNFIEEYPAELLDRNIELILDSIPVEIKVPKRVTMKALLAESEKNSKKRKRIITEKSKKQLVKKSSNKSRKSKKNK